MSVYPLIIFFTSVIFTLKIIYDTRGVCFFSGHIRTDNEKMVKMASEIRFWDWPSKMHSISYGRGQLREYWVLGLNFIGNFFKDKSSDHLNIVLALCANCVSSILIYFIAGRYFGPEIGFIAALLYITSFWTYHVAVYMGHIHLSQMFFLIAVYALQCAEASGSIYSTIFFFLAGVCSALSFSSSSASRKYLPLILAAFLYVLRDYLIFSWSEALSFHLRNSWTYLGIFILGALFAVRILVSRNQEVLLKFLSKISKKDRFDERYADGVIKLLNTAFWLGLFCIFFVKDRGFYLYGALFTLGIMAIFIHLSLPFSELKSNIYRYYNYLNISKWASHFNAYKEQEKIFGKKLPKDFRGAGFRWIPRLFLRVMPVIFILYIISTIGFLGWQAWEILQGRKLIVDAIGDSVWLVGVSLLPIITVEVTKGLQVGKSYMPSIIGLLFMICCFLRIIGNFFEGNAGFISFGMWIMLGIVLFHFLSSVLVFYRDVLPARMAPTRLRDLLHKLKMKKFYTYDNPYNEPLVRTMLYTYPDEFEVCYIESIDEVKEGIIVIPGTSSKSVQMETNRYAIEHGDFRYDGALNKLYADRMIEKLAIAKIKTMGCSKIYVHESEVTSYRDLILKQITDYDRWLSNAWILPAESLCSLVNITKERV